MEAPAPKVTPLRVGGVTRAIPDRGLTEETCKKLNILVEYDSTGKIAKHHYLYAQKGTGELKSAKTRMCATKDFPWSGDRTDVEPLWGMSTCKGKGKYLTITEGEIDRASVWQMFDGKYDVVSLKDGADSARRNISEALDFLDGYQNIVLMMDDDEAGRRAFENVKDVIPPGKLQYVWLPRKDANAMLTNREVREFIAAFWGMKSYTPDGIVECKDTWDQVMAYATTPSIPYPWVGLDDLLMGQRTEEIVVWAAPTGIGKSHTMREIQDFLVKQTDDRVGTLMLEESIGKTMMGWMSFHAGRPLHKEMKTLSQEELKKYWDMVAQGNRFVMLDHNGWQNNLDTLKARIRHMVHVMGCRWVFLDHLHIALSSIHGATGDWSGIDELMTDLRSLVHELKIGLHLVSHVSGERSLRGSKGIGQLADAVIFLDRNKEHEDPVMRNVTTVYVDKNRWAGDSGVACYLQYDPATHRMTEIAKPAGAMDDF